MLITKPIWLIYHPAESEVDPPSLTFPPLRHTANHSYELMTSELCTEPPSGREIFQQSNLISSNMGQNRLATHVQSRLQEGDRPKSRLMDRVSNSISFMTEYNQPRGPHAKKEMFLEENKKKTVLLHLFLAHECVF